MLGRQSEKMQEMLEMWQKTLQLLRELREGQVLPSQLSVDERGWELLPREEPVVASP